MMKSVISSCKSKIPSGLPDTIEVLDQRCAPDSVSTNCTAVRSLFRLSQAALQQVAGAKFVSDSANDNRLGEIARR